MAKDYLSTTKIHISKILGVLLALPFSYPAPPAYWLGFLVSGIIVFLGFDIRKIHLKKFIAVLALVLCALISNLVNLQLRDLEFSRIITTSFFFLLLLTGTGRIDAKEIVNFFSLSFGVWAIVTVYLFIKLGIYDNGLIIFSMPEYRLWGSEVIPDWPNFFAFMLTLCFLLNSLIYRRFFLAILQFSAAVLTTSRSSWLGLIIVCFFRIKSFPKKICLSILLASVILVTNTMLMENVELLDRLLVIEDRLEIFEYANVLFMQSPVIGHGSILFDTSVGFNGHASFHNSYLDISVRHGIFALILFLFSILPLNLRSYSFESLAIIIFFFVSAFSQNIFKHPHLAIVYSMILYGTQLKNKIHHEQIY